MNPLPITRSVDQLLQMKVADMCWNEKRRLTAYLDELCDYPSIPELERRFMASLEGKKLAKWAEFGRCIIFAVPGFH